MNMRNIFVWLILSTVLFALFDSLNLGSKSSNEVAYSEFIKMVKSGSVSEVEISGLTIKGKTTTGSLFQTTRPDLLDLKLVDDLLKNNVKVIGKLPEKPGLLTQLLISAFPMLLFLGIFIFLMRQQTGGAGGKIGNPFSFGKSKAKKINQNNKKINFSDVAGIEESKEEVSEIVDFLKEPKKFHAIGAKIPKGVLMVGPPGTGKTLLARAVAGEAEVNFFSIAGSDFVEMFVGVGASRVRDMFEKAKAQAPSILFIDEIDAVGRQRGSGLGGGHDEREQTLNQLLVEMDGFENETNVIVIAATNRADILDPALLRPGRFDRQVYFSLPDIRGREAILKVHSKNTPLAKDVDLNIIAKGTAGFSGAELANLINEASLIAARANNKLVDMSSMEEAIDKILMGPARKSMILDDRSKLTTAYHESGHAVLGELIENHDPVHKVSIMPRGPALGVTSYLPKETYGISKDELIGKICVLYGGRVAEEIKNGINNITTGAQNDIERATKIARNMVTKWGFSKSLGPINYEDEETEIFLSKSMGKNNHMNSQDTSQKIDDEVRDIINFSYNKAYKLLKDNWNKIELMVKELIEYETIDTQQVKQIMTGEINNESDNSEVKATN